jgi:raffinose/stachyose/melibiose transport system substrate-binding protein
LFVALLFAVGASAQTATLNVLYYIDATAAGYDVDKAQWDKFTQDNPTIAINKEELFNEPFHQKVQAYIASGNLPDIVYAWPSGRSAELHKQKLLRDLKPLLGAPFLKDFTASALDTSQQSGGYLGVLPQSVTYTSVLYVNNAVLKAAGVAVPKTYADLKAAVPKLRAKGYQTIIMANKDTWVMQSCLFSTISGRIAGDKFIDDVKAGKAKFTDAPFVNALRVVDNLYKDGILSRDTIQIGYGEVPNLFATDKAAILIDGDWRQGAFLTDKASGTALIPPAKQASDFSMINLPALPGEKFPGVTSAIVGVGMGVTTAVKAGSDKEKAAVKFMKYWYGDDVQRAKLETGSYIPSRTTVKSDKIEPFTTKIAAFYATIKKTSYVLDGVLDPAVYAPLNDGLQAIGLGTRAPEQVALDVQNAYEAWAKTQM